MTTISIIIPTIGRLSLDRAVMQALDAMGPEDELIVVGDGPQQRARQIMSHRFDPRARYMETLSTRAFGCFQYDVGSMFAIGDFLMFATDDDEMPREAVRYVRAGVEGKPWPHVFSMFHRPMNKVLRASINSCEVGAQQIVVPNIVEKLARWSDNTSTTNDHAYLLATLARWQRMPEFHNEIIAILCQHNMGRETV
jgi:glycosyltransferase involved in cell wall biosynthesis